MRYRVFTFGELLLRLRSSVDSFLYREDAVTVYPGGSEANVAASLAQWGVDSGYMTAVPDNGLSQQALGTLSGLGVDTKPCLLTGDRIGLYFLLSPNGLTKGDVIYDRKYSAFSHLKPGQVDWESTLEGYSWLHWSALTPALSENLAEVCREMLEIASQKNLTVSIDLNYRNKLWQYGKEPWEVMPDLVRHCDVIMGNIWAANKMLRTPVSEDLGRDTDSVVYFEHSIHSAKEIFREFPKARHIANTFRFMDSPIHNLFYGTYHSQEGNFISDIRQTEAVIDRIGSGDAFMAGLIYALTAGKSGQQIVDTATAAGFQKLFVKGDFGDGTL